MLPLTILPLWLSSILLVALPALLAMAGTVAIRNYVKLDRLRTNNEVAGFKFATVGVLYAVMLGFAIIVVWEKFNDADNEVAKEASAAATIYRLSDGIGAGQGAPLRDAVTGYLKVTINKDWAAMEHGTASHEATEALSAVYATLLRFHPATGSDLVLVTEILHQLDLVGQARRTRLVTAAGIVPGIVWAVLFVGALVTISFTFFFGTENLRAQTMMTGALSVLIFSGLLTVVVIDHPFAGPVKVRPEALVAVLEDFGGPSRP
jgi:hypothetical protein